MSELTPLILTKIEKVEEDINDIKVTLVKNTADMERHISRTDGLQDIVHDMNQIIQPMYQEFVSKKAVEEYKKKQREELLYRLKLPAYIVAACAAIGTALAWIMRK